MNNQTKIKTKNFSIFLILSITLLVGGNNHWAFAEDLNRLSDYSILLSITPSQVEKDSQSYPIGYVYILNKNDIAITSSTDVEISLKSDNSSIVSVPEKITFPANAPFAKFDLTAIQNGKTRITADLNGKISFTNISVGSDDSRFPDELVLELNLPTNKMHVSSEMPFSVFLREADEVTKDSRGRSTVTPGSVIRAPYDLDVRLDYEKSLATPNQEVLTIKQGEYYAWGTIKTGQKVGNAFIRATQEDTQLDTAKSIEITSTLPAALSINVYPYLVPAEINRNLDVFVSVLDSNGDPTIANQDIPLKFFSNNQDYIGDDLDDFMKSNKMVIKKGQFGYHFKLNVDLLGLNSNDLFIGVSSAGFGTAIDKFQTVCESISVEDQRIQGTGALITSSRVVKATDKKAVQLFGPLKIPSNATAIFGYQMAIEENDDDDAKNDVSRQNSNNHCKRPSSEQFEEVDIDELITQQQDEEEKRREGLNSQDVGGIGDVEEDTSTSKSSSTSVEDLDVIIYSIDNLVDGNLYPLQANEDYRSTGLIQYLDIISEDSSYAEVVDPGKISPSYSYGVAQVKTTQKSGEFLISANIKGIGTGSYKTEVVNSLEQKEIRAFSPTGENSVLINRDGSFDLFLVALDGSERPKTLDKDSRYLITPSNGIVDVKQGNAFDKINLQSESFRLEDGSTLNLKVESIGQDALVAIKSEKQFDTQLSSKLDILFPNNVLDVEREGHVGVVQLKDLQGNPIESFKDIRVKLTSDDASIVEPSQEVVIKTGQSYAEFPITAKGELGSAEISATARGVIGGSAKLSTLTSSSQLYVSTSGLIEPIPPNENLEVKIFVDDDSADYVAGATVTITAGKNSTVTPTVVRTGPDGSATFNLKATGGPKITLNFAMSAEGYQDSKKKTDFAVDMGENTSVAEFDLPQELIYVIIGGIAVVGVIVGLFLKRSKEPIEEEEPWEEEDI